MTHPDVKAPAGKIGGPTPPDVRADTTAGAGVRDGRSVADLLLDADLTARAALWDPDPESAKGKVRTWAS